jgi:spermidine synthase
MHPGRKGLISTFLVCSGATALAYELIWSRHLGNLVGSSGEAHAVVLATFLGGLALGAWLFGRAADRAQRPLRLYGLLELGIAAYAVCFPLVLETAGAAYVAAAPALSPGWRVVARVLACSAALLPPTLLMGGTLPALVRHLAWDLASARREVARLYGLNALGAAAGAFVAGVRLVPALGLQRAGWVAAGLNALVALAAILLSSALPRAGAGTGGGASPPPLAPAPARSEPPAAPASGLAIRAALAGAAISGFTSMLYEMGWIRILSIVLGASAYAFTLILSAFILGISLGSFWLSARRGAARPLRVFGWMQAALALSICAAIPLYLRLPYLFYRAQAVLQRTLDAWPLYQGLTFLCSCAVLLLPTFFMGASFPAVAQVAGTRVEDYGRSLGRTYLWNTVGSVTGALVGGLVLIPALGLERCFALGMALNLAAAGVALAVDGGGRRLRTLAPAGAVGLLAVGAAVWLGPWGNLLANGSTLRMRGPPPESFAAYRAMVERDSRVLFRADDTFATVLVAEVSGTGHRMMKINGKVDASNGLDAETQVLAGHLGVLLHPREVKQALVIGAGAALTAGSVLAHPVESLDLVEISPAVIDGARLFGEDNRGALDDPRTRIHLDDAKTFLAGQRASQYDLVVSVPSNPWVSGVAGLFTREFFRAVEASLAEDGVLVQWIHTYESDAPLVRLVMRTMRETFPHATTWVGPQDLVMVASRRPLTPDLSRLAERMARPEVKEDLRRVLCDEPFVLLAKQVHSDEGQRAFAGEGPVNTDDANLLEYASPVAFFLRRDFVPVRDERRAPGGGPGLLLYALLKERPPMAGELQALYRNAARYHAPDDPWVRSAAEAWLAAAPDDAEAALAVAQAALAQRDFTAALAAATPAVERGDRSGPLVAAYARAAAALAWSGRSVVHPVSLERALEVAREAGSKEALESLCEALPAGACEGPSPRNKAVLVPSSR